MNDFHSRVPYPSSSMARLWARWVFQAATARNAPRRRSTRFQGTGDHFGALKQSPIGILGGHRPPLQLLIDVELSDFPSSFYSLPRGGWRIDSATAPLAGGRVQPAEFSTISPR